MYFEVFFCLTLVIFFLRYGLREFVVIVFVVNSDVVFSEFKCNFFLSFVFIVLGNIGWWVDILKNLDNELKIIICEGK